MESINISEILSITLTLFAIIDVLGNIPAIISLKKTTKHFNALHISLFAGGLMILFLFLGNTILSIFGLEVSSFALAGSVVIFLLGLEMILGIHIFKPSGEGDAQSSLIPIAFPLLVGAGTLTVIISMRSVYSYYNILIAIFINIIIMYVALKSINFIERKIGKTTLHALTKFFGVITLALAIQIFLKNLWK